MRVRPPRVSIRRCARRHVRRRVGRARVRSVTGKRTRLLIEVVRVRFPPDLLPRRATSVTLRGHGRRVSRALERTAPSLRDRLAGRTLVSETRNAGSTPAPGTRPRTQPRARLMLSENLAPLRPVRVPRSTLLRATRTGRSFQRSRMVRQPAVNRSLRRFDSSRWSSRVHLRSARRLRRVLPARVLRVRSCPCFSMVEHPLRMRRDPVRLRAWALFEHLAPVI